MEQASTILFWISIVIGVLCFIGIIGTLIDSVRELIRLHKTDREGLESFRVYTRNNALRYALSAAIIPYALIGSLFPAAIAAICTFAVIFVGLIVATMPRNFIKTDIK